MKTRIYIITRVPGAPHMLLQALVDASSAAQATSYIADKLFTVRPATGHEIASLMAVGHKVEAAGKEAKALDDSGALFSSESVAVKGD